MLRSILLVLVFASTCLAGPPAELAAALKAFRADPPKGWSYTQTTTGEGRSTVERCDAGKPEFARWTLLEKDGRAPTAEETREYREMRSRRSRGGTAPSIVDRLDAAAAMLVDDADRTRRYRMPLQTAESGDRTARHLEATVTLDPASGAIVVIQLRNREAFSPTLGVTIQKMETTMTYAPPRADTPSLPQSVTTRVRGRAFWFKSLDADMDVTFSAYERVWARGESPGSAR